MQNKLIAEGLGTFTLVLAIQLSLFGSIPFLSTPVIAALVLALFVYTIGSKSGCHINPAVTLGLWSINKVKTNEAVSYIIAQLIGAGLAAVLLSTIEGGALYFEIVPDSWMTFFAEVAGALFFGFGIAAVVYNKVRDDMNGLVIGGSLLVGIILAAGLGSSGVLNPAVALSIGAVDLGYVFGSIVGVMLGMNLYRRFIV
jgi:glycerol uptake facilitator-like aquaporin